MKGDKNNIFFNMIHYVLSEQANVDWILKSSFINFTGLQTEVNFSKFQKPNLINDILDYITHIKPYHTKFDQFIEKYTSKNDKVKIQGDRKEATDGSIIVIHNLVEFFNVTQKIRFDNVSLIPDINNLGEIPEVNVDTLYSNSSTYKNLPTKSLLKKFWDTTSANRLFSNTTKDIDTINDILRGGFKGLTLNGGDFLIDAYGYDSRVYDSDLYDAPTLTNEYFIVNYNEPEYTNYTKTFIKVQINLLKTNHPFVLTREKVKVKSIYNGIEENINEFNIIDDIVNIFRGVREYEKIIVTVSENNDGEIINYNYIFVAVAFFEETTNYDNKKFAEYGQTIFKVPDAQFGIKTMRVYLTDKNGGKTLFTNYEKSNDVIIVNEIIPEFCRLSLVIIDYSFIYDKIYAYEDVYASQNNLMYLDGEGFLRPHWDVKHPSELTISRTLDSAFIKKYINKKAYDQIFIDSQRNSTYSDWDEGENTILTRDLNIGDSKIYVKDGDIFERPKINKDGLKEPGILFLENEIIEFYEIEGNVISSIKRATRGSSFKNHYDAGTIVWDYASNNTELFKRTYYNIGYPVKEKALLLTSISETDNSFYISDTSFLHNKPIWTYNETTKKSECSTKGKLYVGNELIEYTTIKGNIISELTRANPSSHKAGEYITNIDYRYIIPGEIKKKSQIDVYKNKKVNMLTDLKPDSSYVIFDKPVLNHTNNITLSFKPNNFFKVAKGNELGIKLGELNNAWVIYFKKDIDNLPELAQYISDNIPSSYNFIVKYENDKLTLISGNGNTILLYNASGYPVQEIFDSSIIGTVINPTVQCNGVDGIVINGFKTLWGNHAHTVKWLKEHPYQGDINEMVLSINYNKNINKQVVARNNENRLEIISINGEDISVSTTGGTKLPDIGIANECILPDIVEYSESYGTIVAQKERADNAGTIVINGKTIPFFIYYEYVDDYTHEIYSRIEDIRTTETIKAEDAIITTPAVYKLYEKNDYVIENNEVILVQEPSDCESIYITNNILPD